mmetsp:Transcript_82857/g.130578  ORF Transcript_82857/g.130578 Transcript_82857/m.130578 type:complete len:211 (-) Transcript_82857:320-952(-)
MLDADVDRDAIEHSSPDVQRSILKSPEDPHKLGEVRTHFTSGGDFGLTIPMCSCATSPSNSSSGMERSCILRECKVRRSGVVMRILSHDAWEPARSSARLEVRNEKSGAKLLLHKSISTQYSGLKPCGGGKAKRVSTRDILPSTHFSPVSGSQETMLSLLAQVIPTCNTGPESTRMLYSTSLVFPCAFQDSILHTLPIFCLSKLRTSASA